MLQENQPLPPFELPGTAIEGRPMTNADFMGQTFVLFVYPKDATPGCTIEAQGFRDAHAEFKKIGVEVVGLSRDALSAHRRFIVAEELPYTLLADKEQTWLRENDLIKNATMYGRPVTKVARTTVLVDAKGIVRRIWNDVTPTGHAAEVLEAVREYMKA